MLDANATINTIHVSYKYYRIYSYKPLAFMINNYIYKHHKNNIINFKILGKLEL